VANKDISRRLTQLRRALAPSKAAWGGCPLEPDVLLQLATDPPADAAALADVPGVGPELTQRLGRVILGALGESEATAHPMDGVASPRLVVALENWRARAACRMAVPAYLVLTDKTLHAIAKAQPRTREALSHVPGVGPRTLAKFGDDLLGMMSGSNHLPSATPASS
jgi:hypothetical protein